MPLYEYSCADCGTFEVIQRFSDAPLTECPTCGKEVSKLMSRTSFQLKGTGWYASDYKKSPSKSESSAATMTSSTPPAEKPKGGGSCGSGGCGGAN